jgi:hypothetical protein
MGEERCRGNQEDKCRDERTPAFTWEQDDPISSLLYLPTSADFVLLMV